MRLNVALVNRGRKGFVLHDDVSVLETLVDIAQAKLKTVCQVRAECGVIITQGATGAHVDIRQAGKPLVQQGSVWFHGVCSTEHWRQLFVFDLDEGQRFLSDM